MLEEIGRLCRDAVVVESEVIPDDPRNLLMARLGPLGLVKLSPTTRGFMKFYERDELNGDMSNWWAPDTECLLGMLRVAGFKYFSRPIYSRSESYSAHCYQEGRVIARLANTIVSPFLEGPIKF